MQALILAAGMGIRLGANASAKAKCMLEVAGKPLINHIAESLLEAGVKKLIIVTGFKGEELKAYANNSITGIDIRYVHNNKYESSNNIYSLYLAKDYLIQDDTVLIESDLIFDADLINEVVNSEHDDIAVIDRYRPWMNGNLALVNSDDFIYDFINSRELSTIKGVNHYKTVNIYKFSKHFSTHFLAPWLQQYIDASVTNEFYEVVLKKIASLGLHRLKAFMIQDRRWYEIDDAEDLWMARAMFASKDRKQDIIQKRFGGYWRFPKLIDFSLPVNQYFPTPAMLEIIKEFSEKLIMHYPSNLSMQNICASRLLGVDESQIVVGNGASELIPAVAGLISGKVAMFLPTYNEYVVCFKHCELIKLYSAVDDYGFNQKTILNCLYHANTLILVNPDNPSGSFIGFEAMLEIINEAKQMNRVVIVDESFIDFAEKSSRYTLFKPSLLKEFPNLIVIKSLGKSYGIPGLRLGVLACGDAKLLNLIKSFLPVWNINSFAEFFLQIAPNFKSDYLRACETVIAQRASLINKLQEINYLRAYDSQANFLLCEVLAPYTAKYIADELLTNFNILIKDLSAKEGFSDKNFIRIAVKGEEEHDCLISALRRVGPSMIK